MDYNSALNKIFSMHQFNIKLGLERINELLSHLSNPHLGLKYFHIAGSNGKGSTASFIASILMEAGYKVGLYTSPHFIKFNERIRINGKMIDDDYIAKFVNEIDPYIEKYESTFFEITTALAFKYFNDNKVDYVILETGLGGRLDATNVVDPLCSIITSISLEHTNILGDKIEDIAKEKAGIIKPGKDLFLGLIPNQAEIIIKQIAGENNSRIFSLKEFSNFNTDGIQVDLGNVIYNIYQTGLIGYHQLHNAALAIKTVSTVLDIFPNKILNAGLMNVVKNTGIQGRYEVISENPKIIFDSAHNPEGVTTFLNQFRKEQYLYNERILIFGAMKDKNIEVMLNLLKGTFTRIFVAEIENERTASFESFEVISNKLGLNLEQLESPEHYLDNFRGGNRGNCLVILGSIYLLGSIKSKLKNAKNILTK